MRAEGIERKKGSCSYKRQLLLLKAGCFWLFYCRGYRWMWSFGDKMSELESIKQNPTKIILIKDLNNKRNDTGKICGRHNWHNKDLTRSYNIINLKLNPIGILTFPHNNWIKTKESGIGTWKIVAKCQSYLRECWILLFLLYTFLFFSLFFPVSQQCSLTHLVNFD